MKSQYKLSTSPRPPSHPPTHCRALKTIDGAGSNRCCPHTSLYLSLADKLAQSGPSFDIQPWVVQGYHSHSHLRPIQSTRFTSNARVWTAAGHADTGRRCKLPSDRPMGLGSNLRASSGAGVQRCKEDKLIHVRTQQETEPHSALQHPRVLMRFCPLTKLHSSEHLESKEPARNKHSFRYRPSPSHYRQQLHRPHQSVVWNPLARPAVDCTAEK